VLHLHSTPYFKLTGAKQEEARLEEQRRLEEEEEAKKALQLKMELREANMKANVSRPRKN